MKAVALALLTFLATPAHAERGALESFDLPNGPTAWAQFDQRQCFQVHTPDTMWVLPGVVSLPEGTCR